MPQEGSFPHQESACVPQIQDVRLPSVAVDAVTELYQTEDLRTIVKSCYKHMGREELLQMCHTSKTAAPFRKKQGIPDNLTVPSPSRCPSGTRLPYSEIFICYFCEEEFTSKEEVRKHQTNCNNRPPELQRIQCYTNDMKPKGGPPTNSPKLMERESISKMPLEKFIKFLDLVPKQKAEKIRSRTRSLEIDCDVLDISDSQGPKSPCTPRTPRSLISQLSREEPTTSKKRLSYSISVDKSVEQMSELSDASDSSEEMEETASTKGSLSLLQIAISSLLGQRIQKHFKSELNLPIVTDSENFCRTPVKNAFLEKLRFRPQGYLVSYKPRRKTMYLNHTYKFNKKHKREFLERLSTGLNKRSRELLSAMKDLTIVLEPMSRKDMLRWIPATVLSKQLKDKVKITKSKTNEVAFCQFPTAPALSASNIDKILGLKRKSSEISSFTMRNGLSLTNVVSEDVDAEVSKQKLTLYRSLLTELSVLGASVTSNAGRLDQIPWKFDLSASTHMQPIPFVKMRKSDSLSVTEHLNKSASVVKNKNQNSDEKMGKKNSGSVLKAILNEKPFNPFHQVNLNAHCMCVKAAFNSSSCCNCKQHGFRNEMNPKDQEVLSIKSVSSDDESLHSDCCSACRNKKQITSSPDYTPLFSPKPGAEIKKKEQTNGSRSDDRMEHAQSKSAESTPISISIPKLCDLTSVSTLSPPISDDQEGSIHSDASKATSSSKSPNVFSSSSPSRPDTRSRSQHLSLSVSKNLGKSWSLMSENQYSLRSGNFLISTPSVSPQKSVMNESSDSCGMSSNSPARKWKRNISLNESSTSATQQAKLRKK
ncbi:hypothetical protein ACJMK2_015893 [Sinanodonta woodiana]|uniref:C2H2-type domain-containing protein n=1 Tax=Sinanodonta woodiana TaxID=1069815 RepID=A0ABD3UT96_SINWO